MYTHMHKLHMNIGGICIDTLPLTTIMNVFILRHHFNASIRLKFMETFVYEAVDGCSGLSIYV